MGTIKELLYNDNTNIYSIEDGAQRLASDYDDENYYFDPRLGFGDYDTSGEIERSNVRIFEERFAEFRGIDWIKLTGPYSSECIAIKLLSTNEEIIKCIAALSDYPAMDDTDVSLVATELEQESWDNFYRRDFKNEFLGKYKADETDMEDEELWDLYCELKKKSDTDGHIESGGNFYIDLKRLMQALPDEPLKKYKLTY